MTKRTFKVDKLIRDKLVDRMLNEEGTIVYIKKSSYREKLDYLKKKIIEEAQEVVDALSVEGDQLIDEVLSINEIVSELGDCIEVVDSIAEFLEISTEAIERERIAKKERAGGFSKFIIVDRVDVVGDDHRLCKYFNLQPDKYPEIKQQ